MREMVKWVARAIFDAKDPASGDQLGDLIDADDALAVCGWMAHAAVEAHKAALAEAGFVIVPREPTDEVYVIPHVRVGP